MTDIHPGFIDAIQVLKDISIQPQALYEVWWSGKPELIEEPAPSESTFHPDTHSRRIQSAAPNSHEVHTIGFATVALQPGEFYNLNDRESIIRRWATWSNSYWSWIQGAQVPLHPIDPWQLRVYIPTTQSPTISVAQQIAQTLDLNCLPYRLKFRRSKAHHRDSIVIWIERRHYKEMLKLLNCQLEDQTFLSDPPPLTLRSGNIGICDHPTNGESVGWMYSELLWQLIRSDSESDLVANLQRRGLNAKYPWRIDSDASRHWDQELEM